MLKNSRFIFVVLLFVSLLILVGCQQDGITATILAKPAEAPVVDGCAVKQGGYCENADLSGFSFDGGPFRRFTCINCTMHNITARGTNFQNSNFTGSNITFAVETIYPGHEYSSWANVAGVDFSGVEGLTQGMVDEFLRCSNLTILPDGLVCP